MQKNKIFLYICLMKKYFNWKQVSLLLANNDGSIRKNSIPKKYRDAVNELLLLIKDWESKYKQQKGNDFIADVVVSKGTLSNLDKAIKKAKPNMDKIKDVDKHLDNIR